MNTITLAIIGMVAVTYVPRLLPLLLKGKQTPPDWVKRTLQLLPFTAIGALIIPDAFSSVPGHPVIPAAGLLAAGLVTWLTRQPFLAVIGSVLVVAGLQAMW